MLSAFVAVLVTVLITCDVLQRFNRPDLPRYGSSGVIGYLITAVRFSINGPKVMQEAWEQFAGRPFMLPTLLGLRVIVGPEHVEILRKSDDTVPIAINELLQFNHTLDKYQMEEPYHISVTRTDITRAIASFIPDIVEETELTMRTTFNPSNNPGPVRFLVFATMTQMIGRISNRAMLGTDLCRNEDFVHKLVHFAKTILIYAQVLQCVPTFARPAVYFILSSIYGGSKEPKKFLIPYLEQYLQERRETNDRRNNIAEYLIRKAPAEDAGKIAMHVMNLNFGSIHTSSIFLSYALFELSVMPESDLESIRTEVLEALKSEGGWNKPALAKFRKIDSLLKEAGRVYGLGSVALSRLTLRDAELDDGTHIPKGHVVSVYLNPVHFNPKIYPNPHMFDAFRFSKMKDEMSEGTTAKHSFTTLDNNYLVFAGGRHACPGRFFAAMELKIMIAHILLNYDISLPPGQTKKSEAININSSVIPDPKAELIFTRKSKPVTSI